jgi:hypothetical protein
MVKPYYTQGFAASPSHGLFLFFHLYLGHKCDSQLPKTFRVHDLHIHNLLAQSLELHHARCQGGSTDRVL